MPRIVSCDLPDDVYAALNARATEHGRALEAEVREILAKDVLTADTAGIGTLLQRFGQRHGGLDFEPIDGSIVAARFD
jgi:plasmid stability protein